MTFETDEAPFTDDGRVRNRADGRVHFSDLKHMAESAKSYRHACLYPRAPTSEMLIGAAADRLVFAFGDVYLYEGRRIGKEWDRIKEEHADDVIVIPSEWEAAKGAAEAVKADPVAQQLLDAPRHEYQRVMRWDAYGLPFAAGIPRVRGGVDLLATPRTWPIAGSVLADLKIVHDVEPQRLMRHAWRMLWPQQIACYVDGARSLGIEADSGALICVGATPPHDVVVLTFEEHDFEQARKSLVMWTERLKSCERSRTWPGYTQSPIPFEPPAWAEEVIE